MNENKNLVDGYYAQDFRGVLWPYHWTVDDLFIINGNVNNPNNYTIVQIKQIINDENT